MTHACVTKCSIQAARRASTGRIWGVKACACRLIRGARYLRAQLSGLRCVRLARSWEDKSRRPGDGGASASCSRPARAAGSSRVPHACRARGELYNIACGQLVWRRPDDLSRGTLVKPSGAAPRLGVPRPTVPAPAARPSRRSSGWTTPAPSTSPPGLAAPRRSRRSVGPARRRSPPPSAPRCRTSNRHVVQPICRHLFSSLLHPTAWFLMLFGGRPGRCCWDTTRHRRPRPRDHQRRSSRPIMTRAR